MHEHEHEHGHGHVHTHGPISAFDSIEQAEALMSYMLDHNRHHAEELHELAHDLSDEGRDAAAALLHEALELYEKGNEKLAQALDAAR